MELFNQLKNEVGEWSDENFPDQPTVNPFIGSSEEAGELSECLNTERQPNEEELDAVGDILVYLADFCYKRGIDYQEAYERSEEIENQYDEFFREWVASRGQLSRSILKRRQGIRMEEDRVGDEAEKRALARMLSCLDNFANQRGYTLEESIQSAWYNEVIDREWDSSYRDS
jgi:NTP pyrophosphatase (non-canonical NTP hydrolase)